MKKILLNTIGVFLIPLFANAQFWEIGAMVGGSNYSGDLSPAPIQFNETHAAVGAFVRANVHKHFTVKGNVYYGTISGSDKNAETEKNRTRNLSFRSTVLDIGINGEVNFTGFMPGLKQYRTSPYLLLGVSVFKFDPQALDPANNEWVRLQPLGTEGQGTTRYNDRLKYSLAQVSIPMGVGVKHMFDDHWAIGFEVGMRKTFTDYLDDVSSTYVEYEYLAVNSSELSARMMNRSEEVKGVREPFGPKDQRGNATNKDWYMFAGLTLSYVIMPRMCFRF